MVRMKSSVQSARVSHTHQADTFLYQHMQALYRDRQTSVTLYQDTQVLLQQVAGNPLHALAWRYDNSFHCLCHTSRKQLQDNSLTCIYEKNK